MALHKDFPQSPHAILDPGIRWFPAHELLRESSMEKLMPPLVPMLRKKVKEFRDNGCAGAADTSRSAGAPGPPAGACPRWRAACQPEIPHLFRLQPCNAYKKIKKDYSPCMVMEDQLSYKFFQGSA
jgi:hypothetical protein